jgi:hypothetical protein
LTNTTFEHGAIQPSAVREAFVPMQTTDLVEFLAQHPALSSSDQASFRQLASLVLSLLHHLYRQRHEQLAYAYAPLDPDRDTRLSHVPIPSQRDRMVEEVFTRMQDALKRANYRRLSPADIQQALRAASQWGIRMRVNFGTLQRLEVYARGSVIGGRVRRNWRKLFKFELFDVPLYQRLVVVFRTFEGHKSPEQFDSRKVYLRMFKNVPQQDVDMMLPASGIQMSWLDHSRIVLPSMYAVGITLWRVLRNVLLLTFVGLFKTVALFFVVLFAIGFGVKSLFTYSVNTRRRYLLNMAQSLYYQNLDNNAGVMFRLLEDGKQQEACEAVLAYFVAAIVLAGRGEVTLTEISSNCEAILLEATGISVAFDIDAASRDLVHLGIMKMNQEFWTALTLQDAVKQLDATWDNWFNV